MNMRSIDRILPLCLICLTLLACFNISPAPALAAPPALFDLALQLDGADDYATAPDDYYWLDVGSANSSTEATWEAFFYVADLNNDSPDFLIYKYLAYQLYINYSSTSPDTVVLGLSFGPTIFLSHTTNLAVGWHHVAATFQRVSGTDPIALYLDGARVAYDDTTFDWPSGLPDSSEPLYIGSAAGTGFASGWLDEVRISAVMRYTGTTYTVPAQRFVTDSDTRGLWHFDEVWGATVFTDAASRAHPLTGHNGAQVGNPLGAAVDPLQAGPVYTITTPSESDDGYCTATDCSLLEAVRAANASPATEIIELQPNLTYTLNQYHHKGTSQTAFPPISGQLTIHGNGAVIQRASSLPCTITREIETTVVEPGEFRLFYVNPGASLSLQALTLSNGCSDTDYGSGGAIYNGGALTLDQVTFSNNHTFWEGGAVHNAANAILTAAHVTFTDNHAEMGGGLFFDMNSSGSLQDAAFMANSAYDGGAIENWGVLAASQITLTNNTADATIGGDGGAIKNFNNGSLTITDCLIQGNSANEGGGIDSGASSLQVSDCDIRQNHADDDGGGISATKYFTLTNSTLADNTAGRAGGGLYIGPDAVINHSAITNNQALTGGGIFGFSMTINHSTISANSALGNGGGIYVYTGNVYLNFVTITDNTADSDNYHPTPYEDTGGGIYGRGTVSMFYLKNTIVAGNHDLSGLSPDCACEITSQDYNLIGLPGGLSIMHVVGPHDLVGADACLAPLADNGGATQTHALRILSPAIDRIPPNVNGCGSQDALDLRGHARPTDGDGDGRSGCDLGAFEAAENSLVPQRVFLPFVRR